MRRALAITVAILLGFRCMASEPAPLVTFSVEWGYSATLVTSYHFNYICNEGYRIDLEGNEVGFNSNGGLLLTAGFHISDQVRIGIASGYEGINRNNRIIPLECRMTLYPKGYCNDGFVCNADAGFGLRDSFRNISAFCCGMGGGYHVSLSRRISIDFLLNTRMFIDMPPIEDIDDGFVPERNIRKDIARYHAMNLSIALNF